MSMSVDEFVKAAVALHIPEPDLRAMEECAKLNKSLGGKADTGHLAEVTARVPGARLAAVAAAFGILPLEGSREGRGWVHVGKPGTATGVLAADDDGVLVAFALWRALSGSPLERPVLMTESRHGPEQRRKPTR